MKWKLNNSEKLLQSKSAFEKFFSLSSENLFVKIFCEAALFSLTSKFGIQKLPRDTRRPGLLPLLTQNCLFSTIDKKLRVPKQKNFEL